jgi:hypothetical protein
LTSNASGSWLCQIPRANGFELNRWRLIAGMRRDHEPPPGVDNVIFPIEAELDPMGSSFRD